MIVDIFSKRQKRLRGEVLDVYQYDAMPSALCVQIVHIWMEVIGYDDSEYSPAHKIYKQVYQVLCKEYGVFKLDTWERHSKHPFYQALANHLIQETNIERKLDVVEMMTVMIRTLPENQNYYANVNNARVGLVIDELNQRFKEHGVGYQFESGEIIRVDSELIHQEAVKPALQLLADPDFSGAQEEFLRGHEHYRHGRYPESLVDCLKAFESTMKVICVKKGWTVPDRATASSLIKTCFDNELIPSFWSGHFSSLRSMLEGGIPTGRNRLGGHGQGTTPPDIPNYLVAHMLHMTASTIVFMLKAYKALS